MSFEESQGIPSVNLSQLPVDITDKLMMRLQWSDPPIKLIELGYRDSEPKDIIKPNFPTPAILIKFVKVDPQDYSSRGSDVTYRENNRIVVDLGFKAYVILNAASKLEGKQAQELAVELAIAINSESRFGHTIGPARITEIEADDYVNFSDDEIDCKDEYVVWKVEWFHEAMLGELYTEGFYDPNDFTNLDLPFDPSTIKEVYVSLDSQRGKIEASAIEVTSGGVKKRIFKGVNPTTGEIFESNYVLVSEANEDQ